MPISQIDYESARASELDLAGVHAAAQALAEATPPTAQPQNIQRAGETPKAAAQETKMSPPTDADPSREQKTAAVESSPDAQPVEEGQTDQLQPVPAPRAEQDQQSFVPEQPRGEDGFKNRIDAARGRIDDRNQDAGELLEQAVTLLETLAQHPALEDYASIKQRLDTVEQMLNSSANVR